MRLALKEARKGMGLTSPNPPVGAVLVKDEVELGRGHTQRVGGNHAEREALARALEGALEGADDVPSIHGSTMYVTLEPCSSEGRTGACVTALIEAGVSRVVYGTRDPNPLHQGRADEILKEAGIEVEWGLFQDECEKLIRGFAMVQREGRPWVIAKTAMSLDGRITRPEGEGQWLTGGEARERVQILRGEVDAILTSGETLRRDDPALTIRSAEVSDLKEPVLRVVVTRQEIERENYQMFKDEGGERSLIFRDVKLYEILRTLAREKGVNVVLLEAGGDLLGAFADEGLIDEWMIFLAPLVCGGPKVGLGGGGAENLGERLALKEIEVERVGDDLYARGVVEREELRPLMR